MPSTSRMSVPGAACRAVVALALALQCGTASAASSWKWSDMEQRRAQVLAKTLQKDENGYLIHNRVEWTIKCNRSAELTAETSYYADMMLEAFRRVFGINPPPRSFRLRLVIHDTPQQFATAAVGADTGSGTHGVTRLEDGFQVVEIQLAARPRDAAGATPGLDEQIDLPALQSEAARQLVRACTGGRPVPAFFREGCAAYFETWDVREKPKTAGEGMRMAQLGRREPLEALQRAAMSDADFRPDLFKLLHASDADFRGNSMLHAALAQGFVDYVLSSSQRRTALQSIVGKLIRQANAEGDSPVRLVEQSDAGAIEADWHRHLCRIVSCSLPVVRVDVPVDGSPVPAPSPAALSNYGHMPQVAVMGAGKGAFDVAWYDQATRKIRILQCNAENEKIGECSAASIENACNLLGSTRLPGDGSYVVGFARDNASGDEAFEYWIARFDRNEKTIFETRIFGDQSSEKLWAKGKPGGAGTARIVYNPKTDRIGFYCCHTMKWDDGVRHQGGYVGFLKLDGKQLMQGNQPVGNSWFYSHNFDQRLIVVNGAYYALAHGDAYPRALGFSRWHDGVSGMALLANRTYHAISGNVGDNTTHCQTGGLVPLPGNKTFAVVFATANERPSHDVCIKVLDENGAMKGTEWLTDYGPGCVAAYPRIARYGDNVLVMWEKAESGGSVAQMTVLDASLKTITESGPVSDVHVSACYDMITLDDGSIVWATSSGKSIRVYRINPPHVTEAKLAALMAGRTPKATVSERVPKAGAIKAIDTKMIAKLAGLSDTARGDVLKGAFRISVSKSPVRLVSAGATGELTFETEGALGQRATFVFGELSLVDRAALALEIARLEPDNKTVYGVAAFYKDCAGDRKTAEKYYFKAGNQVTDTIAGLFELE